MRTLTPIGSGRALFTLPGNDFRAFASAGAPTLKGEFMASVKDYLIAARTLIDTPEKWGKNFYYESDGCLCIVGAVGKAMGLPASGGQLCGSLIRPLNEALPDTAPIRNHLPSYNDHPDTTHADIMALFDRAIAAQDATP